MKEFFEKLTGVQFLYVGIAGMVLSILCSLIGAYLHFNTIWFHTLGFQVMICLPIMGASFLFYCIRKYQSFLSEKDDDFDINKDPYILYLRSFNDDVETDKPQLVDRIAFYTEEEILVVSLKKLGKAVAIGRPGEKAPPLGAKRIYVSDDQWQDKVRELSTDARLVIFRLGETEGLKWEWNYCLDAIEDISKLLLVVPASMISEQNRIDQLVASVSKQRRDILCNRIDIFQPLNICSIGLLLYFEKNEDGTYTLKQTRGMNDLNQFSDFAYFKKAFFNTRPKASDFYMTFCFWGYTFASMRYYLEPIFNRFNISPFNEKLAYWMFRIIQAVVYFFVADIVILTILIICGLLGMKL